MSTTSSTAKNKKQVVCYIPTSNQFENIKPIEVKCFPDDNQKTIETEKQKTDTTATIVTTVPHRSRPSSAPLKKRTIPTVTTDTKPTRHLAILPSSKERSTKGLIKHAPNLSETFTMYDGPTTTPVVGRSVNETNTLNNQYQMSDMNCEIPVNIELNNDDTTISSVCELIDQTKLKQKPHSLIGRYQLPNADTSSPPPRPTTPSIRIATVHYGDTPSTEPANKQVLIQQFYNQLEKMKATFNTKPPETPRQLTTNTLTFDNGQVKQTSAIKQIQEKTTIPRVPSATMKPIDKKPPPAPQKPKITKNLSSRIQSAPTTMSTKPKTEIKRNSISSCKPYRNEKLPIQPKKSVPTKDKQIRRIASAPPNRIDIHGPEVTLLPKDEEECRQMYEKLQRLQPNGACVDLNTLRRALYPPLGIKSDSTNHDQTSAFKSYRQRTDEMPQSWIKIDDKYVPKQQSTNEVNKYESNLMITSDYANIDRIADQVKKHAAINYSYYTRTK
ncbi:unnamed protein product [Adineta steineri]|uniref:Uncharacterized protein n=2 Tax=Adineta steineri TaxID=433720 RepID=A0A819J6I8_9BILA|nr:unnamed protein product [Adineta steineri]